MPAAVTPSRSGRSGHRLVPVETPPSGPNTTVPITSDVAKNTPVAKWIVIKEASVHPWECGRTHAAGQLAFSASLPHLGGGFSLLCRFLATAWMLADVPLPETDGRPPWGFSLRVHS